MHCIALDRQQGKTIVISVKCVHGSAFQFEIQINSAIRFGGINLKTDSFPDKNRLFDSFCSAVISDSTADISW